MPKKIRCPRCDNPLFVDLDKYEGQQAIHMHCNECGRNFGVKLKHPDQENLDREKIGSVTVLENILCYKQTHSLYLGKNMIGRRTKGNEIEIPIESGDDDMARNHCLIEVSRKADGSLQLLLSDFGSRKGTFYQGVRLGKYDKIALNNGDSVVIGSTIFVVNIIDK